MEAVFGYSQSTLARPAMTENTTDVEREERIGAELGQLMNEAEQMATRTLIEEAGSTVHVDTNGTIDSIFHVLSHPGRRYILTYLRRSDGYVTMTELVDYVMDRTTAHTADGNLRQRITVKLTHTHLPTLVEHGFVEYNMERQMIIPTEKTRLVDPYLKLAIVHQRAFDEETSL